MPECCRLMLISLSLSLSLFIYSSSSAACEPMQKVGEARMQVFIWPVYHSSLFTADGRYQHQQVPVRLTLSYLRDIDASQLIKQTRKEWQHLNLPAPQQEHWLQQLQAFWPDVHKGDQLSVCVDHQRITRFFFNQQPIGNIEDPMFAEQFLAIWLSPDTSKPDHRQSLIGAAP